MGIYNNKPIKIFNNNKEAITLSKNSEFYKRTKYIGVVYYWVKEVINCGVIKILYINLKENIADGLTKPLIHNLF